MPVCTCLISLFIREMQIRGRPLLGRLILPGIGRDGVQLSHAVVG